MATGDGIPAALLLTGGASQRLGRDKATLLIRGVSLADRAARLLAQVADPVIEVGPGCTGLPRAREDPPGAGPLAAVAAGAEALASQGHRGPALVLAVDMPLVGLGLLQLVASHPSPGCVVPIDQGGYPQPLCARYSRAALDLAASIAGQGSSSLRALLPAVAVTWLSPSEWVVAGGSLDAFADIDTAADLARLEPLTGGAAP